MDANALIGGLNEVLTVAKNGNNGYAKTAQKSHQLLEGKSIVACAAGNYGQGPLVSFNLSQQQEFRDEFCRIPDINGRGHDGHDNAIRLVSKIV